MANFLQRLLGMGQMGMGMGYPGQIPGIGGPWTPPINPNASAPVPGPAPAAMVSPRFAGPAWLQKMAAGANKMASGLAGGQPGQVPPQVMQATLGALLAGSGPAPKGTRGILQPFGEAMLAGQQARSQFDENEMRRKLLQAQIGQMTQPKPVAPDEILARMKALGYSLDQEGFKQYNLDQAKQGTTINIGDEMNKPIPIAQLDTVRLPDGRTPPIGTTFAQAREMGAQVLSAEDQKRTIQADQALGILNQLEEMAIGENGVFNEVAPGLANRAASAIDFGLNMLTQNDPRASQFHDMSQATLAPFIKFLGETGSLAQGDVQRAIGLLPRIFPLPDTGEVARDKISELREIITRGVQKMNSVSRQSDVPTTSGPVQINSDAEYESLPSGAQYIAPDGSTRTKR